MERKVKRSEELLNRIANRTGMTTEGKNWLIRAVDPFHDLPVEVEGYPDGQIGNSVVQTIPLSMEISRPSVVPSTDNWDVMIYIDDSPSEVDSRSSYITRNMVYGAGDLAKQGYCRTGGLTVASGATGSNLTFLPSAGSTMAFTGLEVPDSSLLDPCRVIAQAFEVRNTTAELYKQGDCVVFEQPLNSTTYPVVISQVNSYPPTAAFNAYSAKVRTFPPTSQQEATILPSSRRFEAREGCYVIGALETLDNEPAIPAPTASLQYAHADSPDSAWPDAGSTVYISGETSTIANFRLFGPRLITPFGRRGAYFAGLSPETTLKINYKVTIERFPSSTSPVINFGRPTPLRDEVALTAYTEILNRMPVGVPVDENGLGDWFTGAVADIIDSVSGTKFASKLDKWQKDSWAPQKGNSDHKEAEIERKLKMIEEWERSQKRNSSIQRPALLTLKSAPKPAPQKLPSKNVVKNSINNSPQNSTARPPRK